MADKEAIFTLNLTHAGPGGAEIVMPEISMTVPFQGCVAGFADIPASTAAETVIPLVGVGGLIGSEVTGILIKNTNESDIGIRLNLADADEFQLAPGGVFLVGNIVAAGANPLTLVSIVTTAEQVEAGAVEFWAFGDPESAPA